MKNVVICGGGIMGCATAYYLAKKGVKVTVVERCEIACAASGKAGGFLARDWCDHSELGQLARASFDLHMQLAEEFPNCDYRKVDTLDVTFRKGDGPGLKHIGRDVPDWVDGPVTKSSTIGDKTSTAQVHPYKLTNTFMDEAKRLVGSEVLIGTVNGIERSPSNDYVVGVKVDSNVLPADIVIITMGPWCYQACEWLKMPRVGGGRAHSVVMKYDAKKYDITPHCLFTTMTGSKSPEIYPRPDGTVYACGFSDKVKLPSDPSEITPNKSSCQQLKEICGQVSKGLAESTVEVEQACYLPTPQGHLPVIGSIPGIKGAYMASGHTCWGILNAPGTGAALAELIADGKCSMIDLSPFHPENFM